MVLSPHDFLLPVHVVGALFRGKFMAGLQELLDKGKLHDDAPDRAVRRRRQRLYKTSWAVYWPRTSIARVVDCPYRMRASIFVFDPCGERGEFHTFVHDGPMFSRPVAVRPGEVVERDGFVFADLAPA